MSHDDIEDLIDKLEREGVMYCIAINKPETEAFKVWSNARNFEPGEDGATAQQSIKEAVEMAMESGDL